MASITNATGSWQSVTLSADEVWQVHVGSVFLDTDATEGTRLGLRLFANDSVQLSSGLTVYYRLASGTSAIVARVPV